MEDAERWGNSGETGEKEGKDRGKDWETEGSFGRGVGSDRNTREESAYSGKTQLENTENQPTDRERSRKANNTALVASVHFFNNQFQVNCCQFLFGLLADLAVHCCSNRNIPFG